MKYFLLLSGLIFGNYFFSQNIKDHKISIDYIQLPKQKINESISTFFTIYKDSYLEKNNQAQINFAGLKIKSFKMKKLLYFILVVLTISSCTTHEQIITIQKV